MNYTFILGFLFSLFGNQVIAVANKLEHKQKKLLKVSVIIPCSPKHVKHLYSLLKIYESQTVLPDEVIISISELRTVDSSILNSLKKEKWMFSVVFLQSERKMFAGENRNNACKHARGDIFICQDADDLPHPQRIEIIKYFFEKFEVDHLLHHYIFSDKKLELSNNIAKIDYNFPRNFGEAWKVGPVTFGNPVLHRKVFEKIQWSSKPRGQDVEFNSLVYKHFKKCIVVKFPLYIYRTELSSLKFNQLYGFFRYFVTTQYKKLFPLK